MALLCVHVLLLARFLVFFSLLNFLGFDLGHLSCHILIATLLIYSKWVLSFLKRIVK